MTDDLVKRLREHAIHLDAWGKEAISYANIIEEAADRIEKLEAALIDILKVPRSEASWGIALVIARHALKEGEE